MKVLLLNGSPHQHGCTDAALREVGRELEREGIGTEYFWIGTEPVRGCIGCGTCIRSKSGRCVFQDRVNEFLEKAEEADGFVFGTPVHYAAASGAVTAFLDRAFYAGQCFEYKPAACLVSARRAGTTAALDQLIKYPTIKNMPVVPSRYWNMVHGNTPEEVAQDLEGMQVMRTLGRNLAWMLKCFQAGQNSGITPPEPEKRQSTNFIR